MAQHKSAIKRIALSKIQNQRNQVYRTLYKTAIKRVLNSESKEAALKALKIAESIIDKATVRNIVHRNRAARKKSQLAVYVNSLN